MALPALSLALALTLQGVADPQLLVDLDSAAGPPADAAKSSEPTPLLEFAGGLLFGARQLDASNPSSEPGLWWSNGNPNSFIPLTGPSLDSTPRAAVEVAGGRAVVLTESFGQNLELVGTDGTLAGTEQLSSGGTGDALVAWRGRAWFSSADEPQSQEEVWSTDGTVPGTGFEVGFGAAGGSVNLWVAGDLLFVGASTGLFVIDDPGATPRLLTTVGGSAFIGQILVATEFGNELWFSAYQPGAGQEWWRSDGSVTGTGLAFDLTPGPIGSFPTPIAADSNRLWFAGAAPATGRELYSVDASGLPSLANDFTPGPGSSVFGTGALLPDGRLAVGAGTLLNQRAYLSGGDPASTQLLVDSLTGWPIDSAEAFTSSTLGVAFTSAAPGSRGVWRTDGAGGLAQRIGEQPATVQTGGPTFVSALAKTWFAAADEVAGDELWSSDGTVAGTALTLNVAIDSISGDSEPEGFLRFGDRILFNAKFAGIGRELGVTDGTASGTVLVKDVFPGEGSSDPQLGCAIGNRVVFSANSPGAGREPWASDGTAQGTVQLADIQEGGADSMISNSAEFVPMGDYALFVAQLFGSPGGGNARVLMRTDGTPAGTFQLTGVESDVAFPFASNSARLGSLLFFQAESLENGSEPWVSDGTPGGTHLLSDLRSGPGDSSPTGFTRLGDRVLFGAGSSAGVELFSSDGTPGGTQLLADIQPGPLSSTPSLFTQLGDVLLFRAWTQSTGLELWRTDGTTAGTTQLIDIGPGSTWCNPGVPYPVGNRALCRATALFSELWSTDGTPGGTAPVPLPTTDEFELSGGPIYALGDRGDALLPVVTSGMGFNYWVLSGSTGLVQPLPEVVPGPVSGLSSELTELSGRLLFRAKSLAAGSELHFFDLQDLGVGQIVSFGQGCSDSSFEPAIAGSGSAGIGEQLHLHLTDAAPGAVALALYSGSFAFTPVPPSCLTYLSAPLFLPSTTTDGQGSADLSVSIPDVPALIGFEFFVQWVSAEPGGPLLGNFAASNALEIVVGP